MKHRDFEKLNFVERYLQGKLTPEDKEKFEIHYMDCDKCFDDVKKAQRYISALNRIAEQGYFNKVEEAKEKSISGLQIVRWLKSPAALALVLLLILAFLFPLYKDILMPWRTKPEKITVSGEAGVFKIVFEAPLRGTRGEIKEISLRKDISDCEFRIPPFPEIERGSAVIAEIVEASGKIIVGEREIFPSSKDNYYSIRVPAKDFAPGIYGIHIFHLKNESMEKLAEYHFRVRSD